MVAVIGKRATSRPVASTSVRHRSGTCQKVPPSADAARHDPIDRRFDAGEVDVDHIEASRLTAPDLPTCRTAPEAWCGWL